MIAENEAVGMWRVVWRGLPSSPSFPGNTIKSYSWLREENREVTQVVTVERHLKI
jgi:hypothetical protein